KRKDCNGNKEECTKNKEKYEDKLASGYAIKTRIYVKCLIQAATANGASLGFSIAGGILGALIPLPGATVGFSILFGFIGYAIFRWGTGVAMNFFEKLFEDKYVSLSGGENELWCQCMV
ncbi:unnamed protein product, partial [Adineta ricciae]